MLVGDEPRRVSTRQSRSKQHSCEILKGISTRALAKETKYNLQCPVTMNHKTLKDKRTDRVASCIHLEAPKESLWGDHGIFQPLLLIFSGRSVGKSLPEKAPVTFKVCMSTNKKKIRNQSIRTGLTTKVSAQTLIVPTVSDTRLVATQHLRNI